MGPTFRWSTAGILTLGMGIAVTVSWFIFFRSVGSYGPELEALLRPGRLALYATQIGLIVPFAFWLSRRRLRGASLAVLASTAVVAWVGEGVVLTIIGEPLVANELDASIAWIYWLVATAGPVQPAAATVGLWFGARHASASSAHAAPNRR